MSRTIEKKRVEAIKRLKMLSEWASDCATDFEGGWEPELCAVDALGDVCENAVNAFRRAVGG